jgi:hypothetical protein
MRKAGDGFALDWDWVLVDFLMKGLTERNHVVVRNRVSGLYAWIGVEPEAHTIEEMKTGEIDEPGPTWCFLSPEKDRGSKNPLESSHQTSVVRTVFGEPKEIEHLCCRIEMDCSVFLLKSESGNPDGY